MSTQAHDGWASYECRIEERTKRGKIQYRWMIERTFIRMENWRSGFWSKDLEKVRKRGMKILNSLDQNQHEVKEYL